LGKDLNNCLTTADSADQRRMLPVETTALATNRACCNAQTRGLLRASKPAFARKLRRAAVLLTQDAPGSSASQRVHPKVEKIPLRRSREHERREFAFRPVTGAAENMFFLMEGFLHPSRCVLTQFGA